MQIRLLEDYGVATVPGTAFDSFCNTNIRISYASSMENLQTAISRIEDMLPPQIGERMYEL